MRIKKFLLSAIISLIVLTQGNVCHAYYWGLGSGLGYYGSSFMWTLSYFMPYSYYGGAYGLGWPLFNMANRSNNYPASSYQSIPNNQNNNNYNNYPIANPNTAYPFNAYGANYYNNSNITPVWNQQQPAPPTSTEVFKDPNDVFNSGYSPANTPGLLSNVTDPSTTLPVAPDRHSGAPQTAQSTTQLPTTQLPTTSSTQNIAALEGFFQTVNTRYKSDLLRALNQPDMRSWAQSLNLLAPGQTIPSNFNKARKAEIGSILKDTSLEVNHKVEILHLLLDAH